MSVHRFPKWLMEEPFQVTFDPTDQLSFIVKISHPSDKSREYYGFGSSLAEAANLARKHREAMTE